MPTDPTDPTQPNQPDQIDPAAEDRMRGLLAAAGETIEVTHGAPMTLTGLPETARRRAWPILAAAASVLLIAGVAVTVARGSDPSGPRVLDPAAPRVSGPSGTGYDYPDDQMPSLLGYRGDEARTLLEGRGLKVRERTQKTYCNVDDQVARSDPAPGATVAAGQTVTVWVLKNRPVIDCVGEVDWRGVWGLARFARGLDSVPTAPGLADRVSLESWTRHVVAGEIVWKQAGENERTRVELADPAAWDVCGDEGCVSVLTGLAAMLTDPTWGGASPSLVADYSNGSGTCGQRDLRDPMRMEYVVRVEVPTDGFFCPLSLLKIARNNDGEISGVSYYAPAGSTTDPNGTGDTDGADDPGDAGGPDPTRAETARAFVDWARKDGPAPHFADRVRILFGGEGAWGTSGWTDRPDFRAGWGACSGLGGDDCAISALNRLQRDLREVVLTQGRVTCGAPGPLPRGLVAAAKADGVALSVPEPRSCADDLGIELWIDSDGAIYAVNLVLPGE